MSRLRIWTPLVWSLAALMQVGSASSTTAQDPSSPAAKRAFAAAARFQNSQQFDLAAEDWEKFLAKFATDPLAGKARYYAGVCRMQLKAYDEAAAHFQQLWDTAPAFELAEDALLNLGWCQYTLGAAGAAEMYAKAEKTFETLAERFPSGKHLDQAWFYLGETKYAQDDRAAAVDFYTRLTSQHRRSPLYSDGLYALGVAYEEQEQHQQAQQVYDRFLVDCKSSELLTEVRMRRAETDLQLGNFAQAEQQFARVVGEAGFVSADHALWRQAYCVAQQDRYSEAGQLYASLVQRFPSSEYQGPATLAAARSYYRGNRMDQAATHLERGLHMGGADAVEAAHWLARIYLKENKAAAVIQLANRILKSSPADAPFRVHLLLDRADALHIEQPQRALASYHEIASAHPQHELGPQALYNTAFTALELENYPQARQFGREFLDRYTAHELAPDVRQVVAEAALQQRDYAAAESNYRELVTRREHPEYAGWRLRLGLALYLQTKYREAMAAVRPILPSLKDPQQLAEAHFVLGVSQFGLEEYEQAAKHLSRGVAAAPDWNQADETLLYLSRSHRELGQLEAAVASVQQLLSKHPDSGLLDRAHYRLGEYQFALQQYTAARTAYRQLLERWPNSSLAAHARLGLGWTEIRTGNHEDAIRHLSRLLDSKPDRQLVADARLARGIAQRHTEQFESAHRDLDAYLRSGGSQTADALFELGLVHAGGGDFEAAQKSFRQVLNEFPQYPQTSDVLYELGWAYKHLEDPRRATMAFRKLTERAPRHAFAAEAHLHIGEDQYASERYQQALRSLTRAKELSERGDLAEQILHKLGWTYFRLERFDESSRLFGEQLAAYSTGELAADARFLLAECHFKRRDYRSAWEAYRAASDQLPSTDLMQVLVFLHGGQAAAQLEKWRESLDFLEHITAEHPKSVYLAEAVFEQARAHRELGDRAAALEAFERAATLSRGEVGARAHFMIGETHFEDRDFSAAINHYRRVMYGFDGEDGLKHWQAMAGYEAGRCAEVQIQAAPSATARAKSVADAVGFYRYVVDRHPRHELARQAQRRLASLQP